MNLWSRYGVLSLALLLGCASGKEPTEPEPVCAYYQVCGGECGTCDDGDPCTEDRCTDGSVCGHIPVVCECTPTCGEPNGTLKPIQTLSQGQGGIPDLEGLRDIVVTANEANVYVAARTSETVTMLTDTDSGYVWADSVAAGLVEAVALSDDELTLYAGGAHGMRIYGRDELGLLTEQSTMEKPVNGLDAAGEWLVATDDVTLVLYRQSAEGLQEVDAVAGEGLAGIGRPHFTTDGEFVYALAYETSTLWGWRVSDEGLEEVAKVADHVGLASPDDLAITPDGQMIYVTGFCDRDIAILTRNTLSGNVDWVASARGDRRVNVGCEVRGSGGGGDDERSEEEAPPEHPGSLVVRPDNQSVIVAAPFGFSTAFFVRDGHWLDAAGRLKVRPEYDGLDIDLSSYGGPPPPNWPASHRGLTTATAGPTRTFVASAVLNAVTIIKSPNDAQYVQQGIGGIRALPGAYNISMSGDGKNLYVAARNQGNVAAFAIDPVLGGLTELPTETIPFYDDVLPFGIDLEEDERGGALTNVHVMRPSGEQVFAVDANFAAVRVLDRDPDTGILTYRESAMLEHCGGQPSFPVVVVASPDGKDVYVGDFQFFGDSCLWHFRRDESGSLGNGSVSSPYGINGIESIVFSADSKHMYTAAHVDKALTHFVRDPATGELVGDDPIVRKDMEGAEVLTMSPDERTVYVTSPVQDDIIVFNRDLETGAVSHIQTVKDEDMNLHDAAGVAVSADGKYVLVAARVSDALNVFERSESGTLSLLSSIVGLPGMDWSNGVQISPDGRFVYTGAVRDSAVNVYQLLTDQKDGCGGTCP